MPRRYSSITFHKYLQMHNMFSFLFQSISNSTPSVTPPEVSSISSITTSCDRISHRLFFLLFNITMVSLQSSSSFQPQGTVPSTFATTQLSVYLSKLMAEMSLKLNSQTKNRSALYVFGNF